MTEHRILKAFNGRDLIDNNQLRDALKQEGMNEIQVIQVLCLSARKGEISSYLDEQTGLTMWIKRF